MHTRSTNQSSLSRANRTLLCQICVTGLVLLHVVTSSFLLWIFYTPPWRAVGIPRRGETNGTAPGPVDGGATTHHAHLRSFASCKIAWIGRVGKHMKYAGSAKTAVLVAMWLFANCSRQSMTVQFLQQWLTLVKSGSLGVVRGQVG